jgi:hypothetical protein
MRSFVLQASQYIVARTPPHNSSSTSALLTHSRCRTSSCSTAVMSRLGLPDRLVDLRSLLATPLCILSRHDNHGLVMCIWKKQDYYNRLVTRRSFDVRLLHRCRTTQRSRSPLCMQDRQAITQGLLESRILILRVVDPIDRRIDTSSSTTFSADASLASSPFALLNIGRRRVFPVISLCCGHNHTIEVCHSVGEHDCILLDVHLHND